jgi:hypothetical protein
MNVMAGASQRYAQLAATGAAAILLIQAAHMVEHVAQVTQKFVLHMPAAHGLLGSIFDLEWVHFVYNTVLYGAFLVIYVWHRRATRGPITFALRGVLWLQGYHVIEHVVKMYQYYALGITVGPKGILGFFIPLIWLHFFLNLLVLILIVGVYRGARAVAPQPAQAMA